MKMLLRFTCLIVALVIANRVVGQRLREESGDFDVLKNQKILNVEYDYSNFGVGRFATEQEYVSLKVLEYNAKEPGKGESWQKSWVADRKEKFEPRFEKHFNRLLVDKGLSLVHGHTDAPYMLIVRTTFIELGYNAGVAAKDASGDFEFDLVDTANRSKVVARISLRKVPGILDNNFNRGSRIAESYGLAGTLIARYIKKKI